MDNQGQSEKQSTEKKLDETLKKIDMTAEQLDKAIKAGLVIPTPSKVDDLPETLRGEIDKKIREELSKSEETIKSQLYKTIEKQKGDIEKLLSAEAAREQAKAEAEAARIKAEQEEAQKRLSLEEKLQQQSEITKKIIDEMSSTYEEKISSITKQLETEKLSLLRDKLIADNGVGDLDVFIPDPKSGQSVTEEAIRQAVELAKEKLSALKSTEKTVQTQNQTPAGARFPSGTGHLTGNQPVFDEATVERASKEQLQDIKEKIWAKYANLMS